MFTNLFDNMTIKVQLARKVRQTKVSDNANFLVSGTRNCF
jgi:hypothetical protein